MSDSWEYEPGSSDSSGDADGSTPMPAFARDPMGVLVRRWPWMVAVLAASLLAVVSLVLNRTATYEAETTILVSSQAIPEEFVRTTVAEDSLSHINAIVGQVVSRQNLAGLVEKYNLFPALRDELPLAAIIEVMREDIAIYPQESLSHTRHPSSSQVFVIAYEYADAGLAAKVANELAGFFTASNIEMRNRQAELTTNFLRRELKRAEAELREQERKITEFMQAHRGGLPGELDANIAKLERLQGQRQSLASRIDASESRLIALRAQSELAAAGPTPRSLLGDLKERLEEQRVILTEEHPNVVALRRRIERLETDIVAEEARTGPTPGSVSIAAEQRQIRSLREQEAQVEVAIGVLDERVGATPVAQEEFAALEQAETVLRESYVAFLRKVQEAELAQSLESAQQGARISVLVRSHFA
jgi:succinoglycan biosynthesis transport protein ExoP